MHDFSLYNPHQKSENLEVIQQSIQSCPHHLNAAHRNQSDDKNVILPLLFFLIFQMQVPDRESYQPADHYST